MEIKIRMEGGEGEGGGAWGGGIEREDGGGKGSDKKIYKK